MIKKKKGDTTVGGKISRNMASSSSGLGSSKTSGHYLRSQDKEKNPKKDVQQSDSEDLEKETFRRQSSRRSSKRRHKDTPPERQRKVSFSYFIVTYVD